MRLTVVLTAETAAAGTLAAPQPAAAVPAAAGTAAQAASLAGRAACAATMTALCLWLQQTAVRSTCIVTAKGHRANRRRMKYRVQLGVYMEDAMMMP
jgi:hypothetical protein